MDRPGARPLSARSIARDGAELRADTDARLRALWEDYLWGNGWRFVEVVLGLAILQRGLAVIFLKGGEAAYYQGFPLSDIPYGWGLLCLALGAARIFGTLRNGAWKRSPRLRWGAAVVGLWYYVANFYFLYQQGLVISASNHLFFVALEAAALLRASIDIRCYRNRRFRGR